MLIGKFLNIPFSIIWILFASQVIGQVLPPDKWYDGQIMLNDQSKVFGKVKYDFGGNSILLKSVNNFETYTPENVLKVDISDSISSKRYFEVHSYKTGKYLSRAMFFEVLVDSVTKLYCREELVYYSSTTPSNQGPGRVRRLLVYKYFYRSGNGQLVYFKNSKQNILRILKVHKEAIIAFVSENKLKYSSHRDLITIFRYYNRL